MHPLYHPHSRGGASAPTLPYGKFAVARRCAQNFMRNPRRFDMGDAIWAEICHSIPGSEVGSGWQTDDPRARSVGQLSAVAAIGQEHDRSGMATVPANEESANRVGILLWSAARDACGL